MKVDAFVVPGKKTPEDTIRRWRQAEFGVVALNTLYPSGVPDYLSNNALAGIINAWLLQNTDWWVRTKDGTLERGELSPTTVGRIRKLPRG
jgi:hypothetical protein